MFESLTPYIEKGQKSHDKAYKTVKKKLKEFAEATKDVKVPQTREWLHKLSFSFQKNRIFRHQISWHYTYIETNYYNCL